MSGPDVPVSAGTKTPPRLRADHGGIIFILLALVMISSMNAIAKYLALDGIPVFQLVWARFVFHLLIALVIVGLFFPGRLRPSRPGLQIGRSAILMMMTTCFYFGLSLLPLAEVTMMMFAAPIFLISLSVLVLGEKVGIRRWVGVIVGIVGIAFILKPGPSMDLAFLIPLAAAFLYANYQLLTRVASSDDDAITTFLFTPVAGAIVASAIMPFVWVAPSLETWILLVASGALGAGGHLLLINAYVRSEASLLAPFGYSSMIWATLYGWALFGMLPDIWAIAGAGLIIASGLYVWHRERSQSLGRAGGTSSGTGAAP